MDPVSPVLSKRIFPVRLGTKGIPFGPPFTEEGHGAWKPFQTRDPFPEEIAAWNRILGPLNWALVLGKASGFVVIDIDPRHGGDTTVTKYPLPPTFTIRTPGGGWHYYFQCPSSGCASQPAFDRGIEIKGDGNIVLVPPSQKNGVAYEIVDGMDLPPAPLPSWAAPATKTRTGGGAPGEWSRLLHGVAQGERNASCARLAGWFLARGLGRDAAQEILTAWNLRNTPPLPDDEIAHCLASISGADVRRRTSRHRVVAD